MTCKQKVICKFKGRIALLFGYFSMLTEKKATTESVWTVAGIWYNYSEVIGCMPRGLEEPFSFYSCIQESEQRHKLVSPSPRHTVHECYATLWPISTSHFSWQFFVAYISTLLKPLLSDCINLSIHLQVVILLMLHIHPGMACSAFCLHVF